MKHLHSLFEPCRCGVPRFHSVRPRIRCAYITANQSGTNFSYTVYNDEASRKLFLAQLISSRCPGPFTVAATPDGWTFQTDNATYIDWFATNSSPPFGNDIAPGAFLGGFMLQSHDPSSEALGCTLVSWDSSTNVCGPSLLTAVVAPSVTNLDSTLAVVH